LFKKRTSFDTNDLESVIAACIEQNASAQRVLFKQFFGFAKSVCLRYCANTEEAEDVLNEGFLKVFQHLSGYDTARPFKAWLRTILVNTAISYHRKYHKMEFMAELDEGRYVPFDDSVIDRLAADDILALVQQLPVTMRTVFSLHVVDGYSLREIADMTETNEATVRSQFARARQRLQQAMKTNFPHFFLTDPRMPLRYQNEN
jgi:RNA polymerase sigma-70 factor, ECF subfamily